MLDFSLLLPVKLSLFWPLKMIAMKNFLLSPLRPRKTIIMERGIKKRMDTKEEQKSRAINVQVTIVKVQMAITIKVN